MKDPTPEQIKALHAAIALEDERLSKLEVMPTDDEMVISAWKMFAPVVCTAFLNDFFVMLEETIVEVKTKQGLPDDSPEVVGMEAFAKAFKKGIESRL